jgi:toxin YoeB
MMDVLYLSDAQADILYWFEADKRILGKILNLLKEITRTPYEGSGNPEALKHQLSGYWSRKVNSEHRIVYAVNADTQTIEVLSCRGHYTDL